MICPRCNRDFRSLFKHKPYCDRVPPPDELAQMLKDNKTLSINSLARQYGVGYRFIYGRLKGTWWTPERLRERGRRMRRLGLKCMGKRKKVIRCRCGVVVEKKGQLCRWCIDEANGIVDYHDRLGIAGWA